MQTNSCHQYTLPVLERSSKNCQGVFFSIKVYYVYELCGMLVGGGELI